MPVYTAYESLTVSTTAVVLTAATYGSCNCALITVEDATSRVYVDGTVPTASVGHEVHDGDIIELESADELQKFRAIRRDSVNVILRASYGRR